MGQQFAPHIVLGCAAVFGVALFAGIGPAGAQRPADASSLEVFGFELAGLVSAGDVEGIVAHSTTSEYTCPTEPDLPQPACQGQPGGTVVEGYWIGFLGAEWALQDRATFVEHLSGDLGFGVFNGASARLATTSGNGVAICDECLQLIFTSVATDEAAVGSPMMMAAVRATSGGFAIVAVGAGWIQHEEQLAYLTGGQVGDTTFHRVGPAVAPPDTGSGLHSSRRNNAGNHDDSRVQTSPPADVVELGRQVATLLDSRDVEAIADLFVLREEACPLHTPGGLMPICEGVPDGETVRGYFGAVEDSDATLSTREDFIDGFHWLLDEHMQARTFGSTR